MKVTKPNWVEHTVGEKKAKTAIYSISVHPDGTRLATGGLDHKVKIWSTLPILDMEAEKEEENPKLLCTMSSHTGNIFSKRVCQGNFADGDARICVVRAVGTSRKVSCDRIG